MTLDNVGAPARQLNISDIARLAGVAPSTVSRALSNPERVNVKTRTKIEKIAAELGYVPSTLARNLRLGKTGIVAVLVPDVSNAFSFAVVRGTQNQLKAEGITQVLVNTEQENEFELDALRKLRRTSDGVILGSSSLTDQQLSELAAVQPLVAINRPNTGAPSVLIDTSRSMTQAVQHLASLGHKGVTYVSGPENSWSSRSRWTAIQQATAELGMTATAIDPHPASTAHGKEAADLIVETGATAVIAFNDVIAISLLQRLAESGVAVPDDVSVVGCDDSYGADFCSPPLTTISTPIEEAGKTAVTMLLDRLNSREPKDSAHTAVLPSRLVVRASTGPARAER